MDELRQAILKKWHDSGWSFAHRIGAYGELAELAVKVLEERLTTPSAVEAGWEAWLRSDKTDEAAWIESLEAALKAAGGGV